MVNEFVIYCQHLAEVDGEFFYRVDGSHSVDLFIYSVISCSAFHNVLVGCALAGYRHLDV